MLIGAGIGIPFQQNVLARLLGSAEFFAPLTHSAIPTRAAFGTTGTFTRATTSTWPNNDGYMVTGVAGEIGFVGARRVRNLVSSSDISTWSTTSGVAIGSGVTDPDGGTTAYTLTCTSPSGYWVDALASKLSIGVCVNSCYVRRRTGTGVVRIYNGATVSGTEDITAQITTEWTRIIAAATAVTALAANFIGFDFQTAGDAIDVWHPQCEDVTAQTTQTAGEYVSVGVESAPYYHGSFVDGVKCFPTDLSGNPLPTQYTYDAVSLNGVAGTYVSTPDSVAASITGDLTLEWIGSIYNYAIINTLISKWNVASYLLRISATKKVLVDVVGTNGITIVTGASVPFNDGDDNVGVKVVVDADNGAGGSTTSIYTTIDGGANWTLLQAATVTAGVLVIADTTDAVMVGNYGTTSGQLAGKTYRARIYNNSTLAVDFDASRYAGGTTLTGSTGETWTLQGNAVIHPTNNPMLGYLAEGARTNVCLQGQTFDSWTDSGATVTANSTVAPDGTTTADTITRVAGQGDARYVTPTLASSAVHVVSMWIKKGTSPSSLIALYDATATVYRLWVDVTWSGTTPSLAFTNGSLIRSTEWTNGLWRIELLTESVVAANTNRLYLYPGRAGSANGETVIAWGAQVELGSFASSYIPTTTVAVTRDADVLTYSSAGNIDGTKGWCYAEYDYAPGAVSRRILQIDDGTEGERIQLAFDSGGNLQNFAVVDGGVAQAVITGTADSTSKSVGSWAANDFKAAFNGVPGIADTSGTTPTVTTIRISGDSAGVEPLFGTIRNVRIGQRQLSASELQAITS